MEAKKPLRKKYMAHARKPYMKQVAIRVIQTGH